MNHEYKVLRNVEAHGTVSLNEYGYLRVNGRDLVDELAKSLLGGSYEINFRGCVCITLLEDMAPELLVTDGDGNEVPAVPLAKKENAE